MTCHAERADPWAPEAKRAKPLPDQDLAAERDVDSRVAGLPARIAAWHRPVTTSEA